MTDSKSFDKDLLYRLCEKYGVELSDKYGKPMIKEYDGTVRPLIDEENGMDELILQIENRTIDNLTSKLVEFFSTHGKDVWDHISASDFINDNICEIAERMKHK